ncbi:MAG: O-antigen ligase family protein [Bacteroidales bacterium]|nr:O-antigen ligase family protein [Bacteroidales bacterium]
MFKSIKVNHSSIYFVGLFLLIISLPLSRFSLSVAQLILVANWLWEADFRNKLKSIRVNKPALILISVYVLHIIGLIFTSDFHFAFNDLRVKLPLLALPIIIATSKPLSQKKVDVLIQLYIGAALVASFISFGILIFKDISDIREISPFISHIRMSLNICLAIFFSGYYVFSNHKYHPVLKPALLLSMIWLTVFLVISESGTGIYVLTVASIILAFYGLIKISNPTVKVIVVFLAILVPASILFYLNTTIRSYLLPYKNDLKNIEYYSAKGNPYYHDTVNYRVENGSYIGLYICDIELQEAWNKRSSFDYDGSDEKGQQLKHTLIRYLNSRGLRKDEEGVNRLSDEDIRNVEHGIANVYYSKKISINSRIYKLLWEYQTVQRGGNPGGLSVVQRLEYWKASRAIIINNVWLGVGIGDLDLAFKLQYEKMNSVLPLEFRHRSHNQFFAIWIAFGVFGLIWFIFSLLYPPINRKMLLEYNYFIFFVVIILSMLIEDTLETQMGVTLYAFLNAFLLFGRKDVT